MVTVRDVEQQEDYDRLTSVPQVAQIMHLNRLLLGEELQSDLQLRLAAAGLHADLLLIYTFDTDFYVDDPFRPLTAITLGLSPSKQATVQTTSSAILMDVRTAYVYAACEATAKHKQLTSAWTSRDDVDRARRRTERRAFENLVEEFDGVWSEIATQLRQTTSQSTS